MKKYSNLFFIIAMAIMVTACSSSSKKIQDKWWFEVAEIGDDIIKFTIDGRIENINDSEIGTYIIIDEDIKLKFRDGQGYMEETWIISSITDNELILKKGNDTRIFRLATDQDFFVGKWNGTMNGVKITWQFDKKSEVEIDAKGADQEEYTYSFSDNKIIVDNKPLEFTISEDKNNLILKGKETINLIRN